MKTPSKIVKMVACLVVAGATTSTTAMATIIDQWDFTYADGTGLNTALSNNGTKLGTDSPPVSVQGNALEFGSNNPTTASTFRSGTLSTSPLSSGQVEVSWDVVSADFTLTSAIVDASGQVGFGLRDTIPGNNDIAFARLRYQQSSDSFQLQYSDDVGNNQTAGTFAGHNLANLSIRFVADFDNAGSAGSFQLYYTLGAGAEVAAVTTGVIEAGTQVDAFRTVQQITNGGTNWQVGDTMLIDNLTVQIIPEPSTAALMVVIGGALAFWRRRR